MEATVSSSGAHLPRSANDPFIGRQPFQCDGSPGMQTARRNADLRTQAELTAVRKLAGCVPHDNGAIDSVQEGFRLLCVLSHDGVGVMTAMRIDMRHGFRKPVDHTRRKDAVDRKRTRLNSSN